MFKNPTIGQARTTPIYASNQTISIVVDVIKRYSTSVEDLETTIASCSFPK